MYFVNISEGVSQSVSFAGQSLDSINSEQFGVAMRATELPCSMPPFSSLVLL